MGAPAAAAQAVVRVETHADRRAVEAIVEEAFGEARVARLVRLIRSSEHWIPELSLVAERDGQVVGYVLLSTVDLVTHDATHQILTLSPLAVRPAAQRQGIGRLLVEEALDRAERAGFGIVVLEGDPRFYHRFGFQRATELGIDPPSALIPEGAWQAVPLAAYESDVRGRVVYPSAFGASGAGPDDRRDGGAE